MNSRIVAWIALALWVVTVATFAWFFVRGNTAVSSDARSSIMLSHPERDLVLSEMRGLLTATQGILEGINQNNPQKIASAARAAGMAAAADGPDSFFAIVIGKKITAWSLATHHRNPDKIRRLIHVESFKLLLNNSDFVKVGCGESGDDGEIQMMNMLALNALDFETRWGNEKKFHLAACVR